MGPDFDGGDLGPDFVGADLGSGFVGDDLVPEFALATESFTWAALFLEVWAEGLSADFFLMVDASFAVAGDVVAGGFVCKGLGPPFF